jgi:hypothetical protein
LEEGGLEYTLERVYCSMGTARGINPEGEKLRLLDLAGSVIVVSGRSWENIEDP